MVPKKGQQNRTFSEKVNEIEDLSKKVNIYRH